MAKRTKRRNKRYSNKRNSKKKRVSGKRRRVSRKVSKKTYKHKNMRGGALKPEQKEDIKKYLNQAGISTERITKKDLLNKLPPIEELIQLSHDDLKRRGVPGGDALKIEKANRVRETPREVAAAALPAPAAALPAPAQRKLSPSELNLYRWLNSVQLGHLLDSFVANNYDDLDILKDEDLNLDRLVGEIIKGDDTETRKMLMQSLVKLRELGKWLDSVQLGHLFDSFVTHGYDDLELLKDEDLVPGELVDEIIKGDDTETRKMLMQSLVKLRAPVMPVDYGELGKWLDSLKLGNYKQAMHDAGLNLDIVRSKTEEEIRGLAEQIIPVSGHRMKLRQAARKLREPPTAGPADGGTPVSSGAQRVALTPDQQRLAKEMEQKMLQMPVGRMGGFGTGGFGTVVASAALPAAGVPGATGAGNKITFYESEDKETYIFTNYFSGNPLFFGDETGPYGKKLAWKTTEHYYQVYKFLHSNADVSALYEEAKDLITGNDGRNKMGPDWADAITTHQKDTDGKIIQVDNRWWHGNKFNKCQAGKLRAMYNAEKMKFTQNDGTMGELNLKQALLNTGSAMLVENAGDKDSYWGDGKFKIKEGGSNWDFKHIGNPSGGNRLGLLLMQIRDELNGLPNGTTCPERALIYTDSTVDPSYNTSTGYFDLGNRGY